MMYVKERVAEFIWNIGQVKARCSPLGRESRGKRAKKELGLRRQKEEKNHMENAQMLVH